MTTIAAKASKTSRGKHSAGSRKPARSKNKRVAQTNQASFNKILDEVIRDYSTTLRKLA